MEKRLNYFIYNSTNVSSGFELAWSITTRMADNLCLNYYEKYNIINICVFELCGVLYINLKHIGFQT